MPKEGSSGRLPAEQGWPAAMRLPNGTFDTTGWRLVEVWETGVAVVQLATGRELELSWDDFLEANPDFSPDGFVEALVSSESQAASQTVAAPTAPAPQVQEESLWQRLGDRQVAVPRSGGTIDHEGWRIAGLDDDGVAVTNDDFGLDKRLSWGQLLLHNPHLLPLNTTIVTRAGKKGYYKGLSGDSATYETIAAFQSTNFRSPDFFQQVEIEPIEPFAQRNSKFFGQPPPV